MGVVVKEWVCLAHGAFESKEESPLCPEGCDCVERAFFTPPGLTGTRTKNIDRTLESLAKSHKLTDLGPGAMRRKALASEKSQEAYREFCERRFGGLGWGSIPKGGAPAAAAQAGASGSVGVADQQAMVEAFKRPVMVRKDPQNLQVTDVKAA